MPATYRPAVAFPAELVQEARHFASGVNAAGEVDGFAASGRHLGITANQLRKGLLEAIEACVHPMLEVFVDSGAFSEVKFNKAAGRLVVVKPITDASWDARFAVYERVARAHGRRARVVAPDLVGDQDATLARLVKYAARVATIAALGAQVIVPGQKGKLPMSEMYATACQILGLRQQAIAGIPMKKDATSIADLQELVASLPWFGARIHLLGLGPESKRYAEVIAAIKAIRPNADISSDSVTVRRLVGRKNGRGGGPRAITKYQDEARARGENGQAVKAYALMSQGLDERDRELERAMDAGWYDDELFDSVEEARAHHAACLAERRLLNAGPAQLELGFDVSVAA